MAPITLLTALLLAPPLPPHGVDSGASTGPAVNAPAATAPASRPRLIIPPGFVRIAHGRRDLLIRPEDEPWVRRAVDTAPPATRPSTLPADLIRNVETRREWLISTLAADLAIPFDRAAAFVDNELLTTLRDFELSPIATVGLVATREQIRAALESGWRNPAVRYAPATGDILFSQVMVVATDPDSADSLIPFLVLPEHTDDEKAAKLAQELANLDESVLRARSQRSQFLLQAALVRFIGSDVLAELRLPAEQEWVAAGITGTLTAKFTSALSGVPRRTIIQAMTAEPPRPAPGYIRAASIDLLNPVDLSALRPGALLPYADAVRRKSVAAVDHLLFLHGDDVLPKLLTSLRSDPPATPAALVDRIVALTGTDLSQHLRPAR